jgi:hypothetical protein
LSNGPLLLCRLNLCFSLEDIVAIQIARYQYKPSAMFHSPNS